MPWKFDPETVKRMKPTQGNPSDPNQAMRWMIEQSARAADIPLFSPDALKQIQDMLSPYFQAQNLLFETGAATAGGNIRRSQQEAASRARAEASYRGYNPQSFMQSASARTAEAMTPSFFENYFSGSQGLKMDQLKQLFGTTAESQKFKSQGAWNLANQYGNLAQMGQQQQALEQQPGIWDYILGGLFGGVGEFASPFLGYGGQKVGKKVWG